MNWSLRWKNYFMDQLMGDAYWHHRKSVRDHYVKIIHQYSYNAFLSEPQNSQEKGMNVTNRKTMTIPQEQHHLPSPVRCTSVYITQRSLLEINTLITFCVIYSAHINTQKVVLATLSSSHARTHNSLVPLYNKSPDSWLIEFSHPSPSLPLSMFNFGKPHTHTFNPSRNAYSSSVFSTHSFFSWF